MMKRHEFDNNKVSSQRFAASDQDVKAVTDQAFHENIGSVLRDSEAFRLEQMAKYRNREFLTLTITLLSIIIGGSGFAWFLLVSGNLFLAVLAMIAALLPHLFLIPWVKEPIRTYRKLYKEQFMPRIADSMGGLQFHSTRGIKRSVLAKTGIVPAHDIYSAEDCFFGRYKNARITLSEARLMRKGSRDKFIFDGIYVLIELSKPLFEGHSVITMDPKLAQRMTKRLDHVQLQSARAFANHFHLLSSQPDKVKALDNPDLFKELQETALLFDNAALSAAFFASKYIFMQIPYDKDMFEASDVFVPITSNDAALRCKKEVDQRPICMMLYPTLLHLHAKSDTLVTEHNRFSCNAGHRNPDTTAIK
jgi:hypothetical protein